MQKMYIVKTENRFDQILLFRDKDKARSWLKTCTRFTEDEIEKKIIEARSTGDKDYITAFLAT